MKFDVSTKRKFLTYQLHHIVMQNTLTVFNNIPSPFRHNNVTMTPKLMNIVHFSVLLVVLHLPQEAMCAEVDDDEIHCMSHDDITATTMDALKASGCLLADACVVSDIMLYANDTTQQHVNTNSDVHMHKCLIFVNSTMNEIPSSIFSSKHRSNISQLFVNDVKLVEIRRVSILLGKSLERANLARNLIREIRETIFYDSSNLRELNLSENQIEKISSNAFEKLTSLEILDLSSNQIVKIPFDLFQNLDMLHTLNMRHNRLQMKFGIFPEFITHLDLSYNNIDIHFKFKIFSFLDNLETLLVHGNRIENIHLSVFNLEHLKYLGISDNLFPCNILADIFDEMKKKHVVSVPERIVRDMSNIRGVKCIE